MDNLAAKEILGAIDGDTDKPKGPPCPKCDRLTRGVLGLHANYFRCHWHKENFKEVDGVLVTYQQGMSPDIGTTMKEELRAERLREDATARKAIRDYRS